LGHDEAHPAKTLPAAVDERTAVDADAAAGPPYTKLWELTAYYMMLATVNDASVQYAPS
jgi:hypothetical protein